MNTKDNASLPSLFFDFFKFGCFCFGGGWSIVAQMDKEYVQKKAALTSDDLLDITSVGRSLPGQMIANVAMLYGCRERGVWGGMISVAGLIFAPFVILSILTFFYSAFRHNYWVAAAMTGVRAAVAPICLCSVLSLASGNLKVPAFVIIAAAAFIMYTVFNINCIIIILCGVIYGLISGEIKERKCRL